MTEQSIRSVRSDRTPRPTDERTVKPLRISTIVSFLKKKEKNFHDKLVRDFVALARAPSQNLSRAVMSP